MEKVYAVIGDPIAHSMSPDIHNDAFRALGIEARYCAFRVKPEDLADAVKGMKALGVAGFNVTVPHKTAIIPLLDEVDELAAAIGAVNTVVKRNGRYIGYNTDGEGFYRALADEAGSELSSKRTLIVGAGGAARAIYYTLAYKGLQVDLTNRTPERAEKLAAGCRFGSGSKILTLDEAEQAVKTYDLLIQTTSVGMSPNTDEMPMRLEHLKQGAVVSDIIYNPLETKWLKTAAGHGGRVQNGLAMFVNQAALSFELWTGTWPSTGRMMEVVMKKLGGSTC